MSLESTADSPIGTGASYQIAERRMTDTARVFDRLRAEILSLERAPGTSLDEEELARAFRTPRSRVREALVRLAGDGHVVILPNQSTIVAPLDLEGIPRFLDALELMQRTTHRLAAMMRTDADLERIRRCDEVFNAATIGGDVAAMIAANYELHLAIAEAGRNPYFTSLYSKLLNDAKRLLHMHYSLEAERRRRAPAVSVVAHGPLVEAIAAGDPDLAEKHASNHSLRFRQRFLHLLDRREVMDFDVRWLGYNKKPARRTGRQKA
jgi:DNA-binding GntR family transcriptional regulator